MTDPNLLDNLDVLKRHVRDESVDLVYLDPPFNSIANYNVLFAEHGEKAAAQVRAFEDTWVWDTSPWGKHPKIQLRTVGELLDGRGIDYPHVTGSNVTHKRAARATAEATPTIGMFEDGQ